MIVNENLSPINEFHIEAKDGRFNSQAISFNELPVEEGEKYTLSFYGKQNEKGSGSYSLIFHRKAIGDKILSKQYECNKRNSFTFVYTSEMDRFNLYADIIGEEIGVSADFIMIKLEKGDKATPYIPNENSIETAKRQYFIGGGTSRKYILPHRGIEQPSFRKEVAA